MKYILGSGGFALELMEWVKLESGLAELKAFVVDDERARDGATVAGIPVIGFSQTEIEGRYLMGVSDPVLKAKFRTAAHSRGLVPTTYISSRSLISSSAIIGVGTVVCPHCTVSPRAVVGAFVTINCRSGIGHHSTIGDYSSLLGATSVNGDVSVGEGVLLGAGALVHPRIRVGDRAIVGIGAVVVKNVASGTTVFGNPAKKVDI